MSEKLQDSSDGLDVVLSCYPVGTILLDTKKEWTVEVLEHTSDGEIRCRVTKPAPMVVREVSISSVVDQLWHASMTGIVPERIVSDSTQPANPAEISEEIQLEPVIFLGRFGRFERFNG